MGSKTSRARFDGCAARAWEFETIDWQLANECDRSAGNAIARPKTFIRSGKVTKFREIGRAAKGTLKKPNYTFGDDSERGQHRIDSSCKVHGYECYRDRQTTWYFAGHGLQETESPSPAA